MRVTQQEDGRAIWIDDELVEMVMEDDPVTTRIILKNHNHDILVAENFNTVVDQIDPLISGNTPEELATSLIGHVASVPLSLLRRGGRIIGL